MHKQKKHINYCVKSNTNQPAGEVLLSRQMRITLWKCISVAYLTARPVAREIGRAHV